MKGIEDYKKILPIAEIYTAVQSEGSRAGYPTVVIRTTGCTHRCYFGEGGWCDSSYTSIHPEKGTYSLQNIVDMYYNNPHIKEMMLTGGSPTMHPALVNELTRFAHKNGIFITMETEGSHFIETDYPIDLLSISPKFSNSVPKLGVMTPLGDPTTQRMIEIHEKSRMKIASIARMISSHEDFHIKPVWDGENQETLDEIKGFLHRLALVLEDSDFGYYCPLSQIQEILRERVYFMPAGDTRKALFKSYAKVFDWVRDNGYKMTWRPHIIAFEDKREV